jgi:hypothetical protein
MSEITDKSLLWFVQNDPAFASFVRTAKFYGMFRPGFNNNEELLKGLCESDISKKMLFNFICDLLNRVRSLSDELLEINKSGIRPIEIKVDWNNIPQEIRDSLVNEYRKEGKPCKS